MCALGATDADLSKYFQVSESTLNLWKQHHPEFSESIKKAKEDADNIIEKSLFQRAKGFVHDDVDIRAVSLGKDAGGGSEIKITPLKKIYPPDTGAAIFWLKNRRPKVWRDKQDIAIQNPDGTPLIAPEMIEAAAAVARLNEKQNERKA